MRYGIVLIMKDSEDVDGFRGLHEKLLRKSFIKVPDEDESVSDFYDVVDEYGFNVVDIKPLPEKVG